MQIKRMKKLLFSVFALSFALVIFIISSFSSYAAEATLTVGSAEKTNTSGQYEIKISLEDVTIAANKSITISLQYNNIAFSVAKTVFSSSVKSYGSVSGENPYKITIKAGSSKLSINGDVCTVYLAPKSTLQTGNYPINATLSGVSAKVNQGSIIVNCQHNFGSSSEFTVEPKCTEGGYEIRRCTKCGEYTQTNQKEALGHDYEVKNTVEPTCTDSGYTVEICTRCHLPRTIEGDKPLDHEYGVEQMRKVEPTCSERGYTEYTCLRDGCGHIHCQDYTDTIDHTVGETVIITPTCQKQGSENKYCSFCGVVLEEKILDIVLHEFEDVLVEPTCTSPGYMHRECKNCHIVRRENQISKIEHSYNSIIEKEADCTHDGRVKYICACGNSYTEKIQSKGHSYIEKPVIDATTESEGIITYVCTECGYTTPKIVPVGGAEDENINDWLDAHSDAPKKLSGRERLIRSIVFVMSCVGALAAFAVLSKRLVQKLLLDRKLKKKNKIGV